MGTKKRIVASIILELSEGRSQPWDYARPECLLELTPLKWKKHVIHHVTAGSLEEQAEI